MVPVDEKRHYELGETAFEVDLQEGLILWDGKRAVTFSVPGSLLGLLAGMHSAMGAERFSQVMEAAGRARVAGKWGAFAEEPTFEDAVARMSRTVAVAGWGRVELASADREAKEVRFHIRNGWESAYQRTLHVRWGASYMAGALAALSEQLFGVVCSSEQTRFAASEDDFDEIVIRPRASSGETLPDAQSAAEINPEMEHAMMLRTLQREIERREQIERELIDREQRVRRYFEMSVTGIVVSSLEKGCIDVNHAFCAMIGYSRDEIMGMSWADFTHPEDLGADVVQWRRVLAGEIDGYEIDKRYIRKGGDMVDTHIRVTCARRPDRSIDYFIAFVQDLTAIREASRQLKRSKQRLARLFNQTPLGVIEWSLEDKIVDWNPAAANIFGFTREEILGREWLPLIIPPGIRDKIGLIARQLVEGAGPRHVINENLTKDGRIIMCEWFNTPLVDDSGQLIGVSSMVQDVTERVRAEREQREHLATIERQRDAIRELAVPIINVWEGVLALPVVGALDSSRASEVMERLLAKIVETRAAYAIVDLTGVEVVDTSAANHLLKIISAVELLGSRAMVTGIRPAVAQTMIGLGVDLSGIRTKSTLKDALEACIAERAVSR